VDRLQELLKGERAEKDRLTRELSAATAAKQLATSERDHANFQRGELAQRCDSLQRELDLARAQLERRGNELKLKEQLVESS
jgi:hypothetical protein